jgi:hypothetical protein
MLIALAAVLAFVWVMAFVVYDVTFVAIHTLVFGAAVAVLVHFIQVRRLRRVHRQPL